MTREICKACGRVSRVGFSVPDDLWAEVVPEVYRDNVVCLACFTEWADESLRPWDEKIELYPVSLKTLLSYEQSGIVDTPEVGLRRLLDELVSQGRILKATFNRMQQRYWNVVLEVDEEQYYKAGFRLGIISEITEKIDRQYGIYTNITMHPKRVET